MTHYKRQACLKNKFMIRGIDMKKIFGILVALCMMAGLTACNGGGASKSEIASAKLTADQQGIVDLLANDKQEIYLFDYQTKEAYKKMEVWVEVYKDGALIDRPAGIDMDSDKAYPHKGRLAIAINQNPGFQWTITIDENDAQSVYRPTDIPDIAIDSTLSRAYGPMAGGAIIESGKEIILYSSVFTSGNTTRTIDTLTLEHSPDILREYEYVHLIKCKFE
jgi:hypothetical protein